MCAVLGMAAALFAQQPAPSPQPAPARQPPAAQTAAQPSTAAAAAPSLTEDQVRQQLAGKTFYLRGGYLENNLHFNDHGQLDGSSPRASYTLSLVKIDRVHLDKHHLQLEGVRYGLHFLGAAPSEDQAVDRVRLTSKKKPLRISIDREDVVAPKKEKPAKQGKKKTQQAPPTVNAAAAQPAAPPPSSPTPPDNQAIPASAASTPPPETDRRGVTVTTSQAQANQALHRALDTVFASGVDQSIIATLPAYWQLYYKAVDSKQDYRPADTSVLRQSQVDQKARLVSAFDPPSNEYAQTNGVTGISMYHVVVEPDGKAGEIAIGRPIGFGLDESAIEAIRKAKFDPAMKDGKPVPVVLDVVVEFRIYSKRTDVTSAAADKPTEPQAPVLPGPYTANEPKPAAQPQPQ
ncbi:MAG TPA: energy transducer TonB [Terracidiphilus sp.]|nr:energy transducer TonB [Terracidiphilus sp.]